MLFGLDIYRRSYVIREGGGHGECGLWHDIALTIAIKSMSLLYISFSCFFFGSFFSVGFVIL